MGIFYFILCNSEKFNVKIKYYLREHYLTDNMQIYSELKLWYLG